MYQNTTTEPSSNLRSIYLSSLGIIFLIAYLSYYVQYPGLSSSAGVEPTHRIIKHVYPNLNSYLTDIMDTDSMCNLILIIGVFLSTLASCGCHHGSIYLVLSLIYGILVTLGNVFYSFQWDILLIETGIATSLCTAPWITTFDIGLWPIRIILFKLMFMSGVVKIQANCPTWENLTALEYHFATQCLPNPLSWYLHQLPPFLLRLSVAMTFLIEIPATFLLIAPSVGMRRIGVILQVLLQVMIISSGNYNFFNGLTIVLCLACWEDDESITNKIPSILTKIFLIWCWIGMFKFEIRDGVWNVKLIYTKKDCENMIDYVIPWTILYMYVIFGISAINTIWNDIKYGARLQTFGKIIRSVTCMIWIGILTIPFLSLTNTLRTQGFIGSNIIMPYYQALQSYHVSNGYGLFRSMTGVGPNSNFSYKWGWAGQKPSIVSRPEIILEGIFEEEDDDHVDNDDPTWKEIDFAYKPGNIYQIPRQIAPYQPRLDWQMWFAALGTYQHNPWFIHLIYKLLDGCHPVLDLLLIKDSRSIKKIRTTLWHYDFTRTDTPWNNKIPNVTILNKDDNDRKNVLIKPKQYWSRQYQNDYLPILEKRDLIDYLSSMGYIPRQNTCIYGMNRCKEIDNTTHSHMFCYYTEWIREGNLLIWFVLFCLCVRIVFIGKNIVWKNYKLKLD